MVTTVRMVVCLSLWLSVCQVSGSFIPGEMNKTIQKLSQNYKSERRVYTGKTVFAREPLTNKTEGLSWKKVVAGSILETYEKLFGYMLKQLPTQSPSTGKSKVGGSGSGSDEWDGLNKLLVNIQNLKYRYGKEQRLLQELQNHRHIQMNDTTVQLKALQELPWLYGEASKLVNSQQRRRRHARRFKKTQRV